MLVLYETSLGFCLFKMTDEGKLNSGNLWKEFETPEGANSLSVHSGMLRSQSSLMKQVIAQAKAEGTTPIRFYGHGSRGDDGND